MTELEAVQQQSGTGLTVLEFLREGSEASVILGAFIYGAGWLFFDRFFTQFGVYPEEVGITFSLVVLRTAIVLMIVAVLAMVGTILARAGRRKGQSRSIASIRSPLATVGLIFIVLLLASTFLALFVILVRIGQLGPLPSTALFLLSGGLIVLLVRTIGAALFRWLKLDSDRGGLTVSKSRALVLMGLVAVLICLVGSFVESDHLARQVRNGHGVASLLFQVPMVKVVALHRLASPQELPKTTNGGQGEAHLSTIGSDEDPSARAPDDLLPDTDECVALLGRADGELVLVRVSKPGDPVVRVAAENVVLSHTLDACNRAEDV